MQYRGGLAEAIGNVLSSAVWHVLVQQSFCMLSWLVAYAGHPSQPAQDAAPHDVWCVIPITAPPLP